MCAVTVRLCCDLPEKPGLHLPQRGVTLLAVLCGGAMYFVSLYLLCEKPKSLLKYVFSAKGKHAARTAAALRE